MTTINTTNITTTNMTTEINFKDLVNEMRAPNTHKDECIQEQDILKKSILCKKYLSPPEWGPIMEKHLKTKFGVKKAASSTEGDGFTINGKRVEIKVSLGSTKGQFSFVQIRPDHKLDYYLFMCYNLYEGELGKVYFFLCKPEDIYSLLPQYGGYAHGTVKELGIISADNLKGRNTEYCLRPTPITSKRKNAKSKENVLWKLLIEKYSVTESDIYKEFGCTEENNNVSESIKKTETNDNTKKEKIPLKKKNTISAAIEMLKNDSNSDSDSDTEVSKRKGAKVTVKGKKNNN